MAPSLVAQAKGSRAFCAWDEDPITMAVEAGRNGLKDLDRESITALYLASTRLPYADLQNSAIVAGALRLRHDLRSIDVGQSQRAGTASLIQAIKTGERALVVGSDAPVGKPASTQELLYGAGAAAFVLGSDDIIARCLATASETSTFVDHFRAAGAQHDYFWEERWIRDEGYLKIAPKAILAALDGAGIDISEVDRFVMPSLLPGGAAAVAKRIGFSGTVASGLEDGCGYAGAAHSLLMLAAALEQAKPGEKILLVGFGQGADALILETTDAIAAPADRRGVSLSVADALPTESYMRLLSFSGGVELEWGMRSEKNNKTVLTEQYRSGEQLEGFVAGRCGVCGTIQFPQLEYCVNPACNAAARAFTPQPLADESCALLTYTADWLSYCPSPPLYVGFVQFDNGARLLMELVDVGPDEIAVGTRLRPVFRIKERDKARGYNRYFWKARMEPRS
jgi:3-hydroxy-3-methylglutaryl CoA synthase